MDARQVTAYPSSLLGILTRTYDPSAIPLQAPTASSEYLAYLTSDLPSHYGAYTALDTPCPRGPFITALASIATDQCIFYRIAPPLSRLDCMCSSFLPEMISNIQTDTGPLQCGSGILAELAIASATQAVRDVCNWRQGPQTVYTGLVPASYASLLSFERSQSRESSRTTSRYTAFASSTTITSGPIATGIFATTAAPAATATGAGYGYYSNGVYINPTTRSTATPVSGYGYGYGGGGYGYSVSRRGLSAGAIAGIVVGVLVFAALLVAAALLLRRYYKRKYAATAPTAAAANASAPEPAPLIFSEKYAPKGAKSPKGKGPEAVTKGVAVEGQPKRIGMPRWG